MRSPKTSPQRAMGTLLVMTSDACSYRLETSWKNRFAASWSKRDVADFINDEQAVTAEPGQFGGEFAAGVSVLEAADPAGRGVEEDPVASSGGLDADADGEVRFPGSGRAEQDDVLRLGQEHARAQVRDQVPVCRRLVPQVGAGGFAFGDFFGEHRGQVLLVGPARVAGLVAQAAERFTDPRRPQRAGVVLDLRDRFGTDHDATAKTTGAASMSTLKSSS